MFSSKNAGAGYLLIDHRAVQAPPQQLHPDTLTAPAGGVFESGTRQCCHCSAVIILNPLRTRPRNSCRKCDAYVCDKPQCNLVCVPMAKVMDQAQELAERGVMLTNDIVEALMRGDPLPGAGVLAPTP